MQTINLPCPGCQTVLELDAGFAGGVCRCSNCGMLMTVPADPKRGRMERLVRPSRPDAPEQKSSEEFDADNLPELDDSLGDLTPPAPEREGGVTPDDIPEGLVAPQGLVAPTRSFRDMSGAPSTLEGYRVLSMLGKGAASVIYEVYDPQDGKRYALKQTDKLKNSDQRYVEQAINEHTIASQFNHPLLRRSYRLMRRRSLSLRTTQVILLMELVEGQTLAMVRPTDIQVLVRVFKLCAQALGHMHSQSVIHADLKPINVMITTEAKIKIIDFGQSCAVGTAKRRIQGTLDYMAPEQVSRAPLGVTTDVYNLGATMFWCVTGHHVPRGATKKKGLKALKGVGRGDVPNPTRLNPASPAALSALILDCLRRDPRHRPASMDQVMARLDMALFQLAR